MRNDKERLLHILDAIQRMEKYAEKGKETFFENELIQNWMLRHLQIIGEASQHLSPSFYQSHPEISWKSIIGLRNILVHQYFDIDPELIWLVIESDLPYLKKKIELILESNSI